MKKKLLLLFVVALILGGCGSTGIFGKRSQQLQTQANKVDKVAVNQSDLDKKKLTSISELTFASTYSLEKITNDIPSVKLALDFNNKSLSLSGMPDVKAMEEYKKMIDNLLSEQIKEVEAGKRMLKQKDIEINLLQLKEEQYRKDMEAELNKYKKLSTDIALKADTTEKELDAYKSWFGLGGIVLGIKRFATTIIIVGLVCLLLYTVLRIAAQSNPVAASIFHIFELIGSWFVSGIKYVAPKSTDYAGTVPADRFDGYKNTLHKIIDTIQLVKEKNPEASLTEALDQLDKDLDSSDKERVRKIKAELNWK